MNSIEKMNTKTQQCYTYIEKSIEDIPSISSQTRIYDDNHSSTNQIEYSSQTIMNNAAQRVEAMSSLVSLLNKAEEEIIREIKLTESSLAEQSKLSSSSLIEVPSESPDNQEEHFCICRGINLGDMVFCEHPNCPFSWFHIECIGLKAVPEESWFCPYCTALMRKNKYQE